MEGCLSATFSCPAEDVNQWKTILQGLANQQWGAALQDRIEYFGQAASNKLEIIMDEYPMEYWYCESWSRTDEGFRFELMTGSQGEEFGNALVELLELCRAKAVNIDIDWDDE
jgi:hypothetical protein